MNMKKITTYYTLSALLLLATGCSQDVLDSQLTPEEQIQEDGQTVHAVAAFGEDPTRIAIQDNGTKISYLWESSDAFTVFDLSQKDYSKQNTLFTLDAGQNQVKNGKFSGTPAQAYQSGSTLYAVFNKHDGNQIIQPDAHGNVTLDLSDQNGTLDDRFEYLFGTGTYTTGEAVSFDFKHLTTTLKVNFTLPVGMTEISELTFTGGSGYNTYTLVPSAKLILNGAEYDSEHMFKPGDVVVAADHQDTDIDPNSITLHGPFKPDANGVVTVYIYAFISKNYHDNHSYSNDNAIIPSFQVKDKNGRVYINSRPFKYSQLLTSGVIYELNTGLFEPEDFANEAVADGWTIPYQISNARQFYTFMLRCASEGFYNKNGLQYNECNYELTNDIVLDDSTPWYGVTLHNYNHYYYDGYAYNETQLFNGNGHTISGPITFGEGYYLFYRLYRTSIRNLVLDYTVNYVNTKNLNGVGGTLASEARNAEITQVTSLVDWDFTRSYGTPYYLGGLVSIASGSTFTNCAVESNYRFNFFNYLGGITGLSQDNCIFKGCYYSGNIVSTGISGSTTIGGITGYANGDHQITGSYGNPNYQVESNPSNSAYSVGGLLGIAYGNITLNQAYWSSTAPSVYAAGSPQFSQTNTGTFTGSYPTAAQIDGMNSIIMNSGYIFDEKGKLVKNTASSIPSSPIENW